MKPRDTWHAVAPLPGLLASVVPRRMRPRERDVALGLGFTIAALTLFQAWPGIDLWFSALFHDGRGFVGDRSGLVRWVYLGVPWLGRSLALLALIVAGSMWHGPRAPLGMRWWRRSLVLGMVMLLGVGGLVNGVLKEHWGRARPTQVDDFGGHARFAAAGRWSAGCATNCSFVSGHAATGFALTGVGLLGSLRTRRRWWAIGTLAGVVIGLGRVAQGGHFLSDVVFAGVAIWATNILLRRAWLHVCRHRRFHRTCRHEPHDREAEGRAR